MNDPPDDGSSADLTEILARVQQGEAAAADGMLPVIYSQLRALAASYLRPRSPGHTLEPTALVHEAYVKLVQGQRSTWECRAHFFAVAAKAMRQILVNHAEAKRALKRGGDAQHVTLSGLATPYDLTTQIDLIDLEEALAKLTELSPRQARIVEMRFLAGIGEREIAHVLGVTERTVQREWRMARAFLACELRDGGLP